MASARSRDERRIEAWPAVMARLWVPWRAQPHPHLPGSAGVRFDLPYPAGNGFGPTPRLNPRAIESRVATWILTGSLENFRINVERGFDVIGFKERRRNQASEFEPGDEIVFYVTGVQAFGGIARVRSQMFEDRDADLAAGKKKHPEDYPWRVEAEPVVVLDEDAFVPAESLVDRARARAQVAGRALAPRLPGPAAHGLRGRRGAAARADRGRRAGRPPAAG